MGSPATAALAPGVPPDYYRAIADVESRHWWHQGMLGISEALLGPRLTVGGRALDAGCGTGGFLRFLAERGHFTTLAGVDIASSAVDVARTQVPSADLRVAPLADLPFVPASFDLVVTNDVLQHVPETEVAQSLAELHRVLAPGGSLLLHTNGSRRLRRERSDWRAYDRETLARELADAGFMVLRTTYANCALSLLAAARGRVPHAPTTERHGIPHERSGVSATVGRALLRGEAWWLGRGHSLPYGHTLFAVAERR